MAAWGCVNWEEKQGRGCRLRLVPECRGGEVGQDPLICCVKDVERTGRRRQRRWNEVVGPVHDRERCKSLAVWTVGSGGS